MKKRFLVYINLALGAISLALAGCHTQKKVSAAAENNDPQEGQQIENSDQKIICLYGVPADRYRPEKVSTDTVPMDTTDINKAPEKNDSIPPRPMLKYGVPNPRIGRL